jgi:hypothetical protein
MSVNLAQAAWDGLISGLLGLKNIVIIVLPLMIFIEAAKDSGVMERITARFHGVAGFLQISKEAVLPLVVGLGIGFSYGSGVIISAAKDGDLSLKDRYAIAIFLSICHSVFEDTLIFVAIGASVSWLMGSRLILAILATLLFGRLPMATSPKMLETGISTDLS